MANYVRVRRLTRTPLRLGFTLVTNTSSGTLVDLDNAYVRRDLMALKHRLEIISDQRAGIYNVRTDDATSDIASVGTGVQLYVAVDLPKGATVSTLTWYSGTTALGTGTHQVSSFYSSDGTTLTRVATSADATSGAWAGDAAKAFNMTTPYVTTYSGIHYAGLEVSATTPPSMAGVTYKNATLAGLSYKTAGSAGSSLTNTQASVALSGVTQTAGVPLVKVS